MLKRLRTQFIVTNTLYVGIVLILVFLLICIFTYNAHIDELDAYLLKAASGSIEKTEVRLNTDAPGHMLSPTAHIVVVADPVTGNIIEKRFSDAYLDDETLKACINSVLSSENQTDDLESDMHFARISNPDGTVSIGIASTRPIRSEMIKLLKLLTLIGACALALVIAVSIPVAKLALLTTENAWEQQKRFIADASHALKTPLTVILANIAILHSGSIKNDEEASHWLASTEEEANGMHDLIRDMLVLTQSDLNVRRTEFTNVNLSGLVFGQTLPFEAVAFDKGITLETDIQENIEIRGNEKALSQMVTAIIDNAFKYEKSGGLVRIRLEKQVRKFVLSIYNASTYISEDEKSLIFDRFRRLKNAETRAQEGNGLGLSIARSVADAHQAVIDVESSQTGGTEFKVSFRHIL
ncbi:MAG: HAMP domain-containing histidine kinase [Clostridia bacterium]|nr:HAMP domain-containing histidine kinase [Clostridia bacterium]